MLNRIPLGGASRVVRYSDTQPGLVRDPLESCLPCVRVHTVRATGVGKDELRARGRVQATSDPAPPLVDRIDGERGRIVRGSDDDKPSPRDTS